MDDKVVKSVVDWISTTHGGQFKIEPQTAVAKEQLLDSLQIMDLVMHLETTFNMSIPLDALTENNFSTPKTIAAMVHKIKAGV